MSKGAARKSDTCTGHPKGYPPRPSTQGSPDVFINGKAAHRKDDTWAVHKGDGKPHPSNLARGSSSVFTNGKQQGRIADPIVCGSKVASGSSDVFVGEEGFTDSEGNAIQVQASDAVDGSEGGTTPYYGSPGGGGEPYTNGGFTNSGSKYANPSGTFAPSTIQDGQLGNLSKQYESGSKGPAAIGYDSTGGYSYGSYQIASNTGTMNNYMKYLKENNPEYYSELQAAGGVNAASRGDPRFQEKWKELAQDPGFAKSQHDFIQATHYDPAASRLQSQGLDLNSRSPALRDVVWSTAVQHGANNNVVQNALRGKDPSTMTDQQIINAIYDERGSRTPSGSLKYFKSSKPEVQVSVLNRFKNERNTALSSLG